MVMSAMSDIPAYRMSAAAKAGVAHSYDTMADRYCDLPFWDSYGRKLVERLGLAPGATVLDVGCGAGASALPAAEAVGPNGYVIGVDLSNGLLAQAQKRADKRGLANAVFHNKDMADLSYPDNYFDAVTSGFSIFFVDDIEGLVGELWRMVKPGGKLAIATWAPPIFEPLDTLLRTCAGPELPDLRRGGGNNMDRVMFAHLLEEVMRAGGATNVTATIEHGCQELRQPEDWWTMVLGSGLRRIVASMSETAAARTRERMLAWVKDNHAVYVATSVVYGVAVKPGGTA
jgi:ubiquinone/menaquinone biosynthesis C-methylase UbiE